MDSVELSWVGFGVAKLGWVREWVYVCVEGGEPGWMRALGCVSTAYIGDNHA